MNQPSPALNHLFLPKSVAIVGASPERGSGRNWLVRVLLKHGFQGRIYPVNPSHQEIEGLKTYGSIDLLPEVPDLALVMTPAHTVPNLIAQCGSRGVRAAIVFSSGFEEVEGGKQYAQQLASAAKEHGVTVLGPNCQGAWSVRARTMLTMGSAALALETLKHAPIAVVSQSGALGGAIGNYFQNSGIGCSYIVTVGNETCIDLLEVLSWVIEQDDVRVAALYLEGLKDAGRILRIAERARARRIQIVALKSGRSTVGQQATASHTGKIASPHAVYADVLRQAGVITVGSLAEILAAVEVLGFLPDPRVSGDPKGGVSIISSSGGASALIADQCDEFGIPTAEFSPETEERLDLILPNFARKANPVDLTGQIRAVPNLFKNSCETISADPRTEALVVQFSSSGQRDLQENGSAFKAAARQEGLPMVMSFIAETMDAQTREEFRQAGIVLSGDTLATVRALSWLYQRQRLLAIPNIPTPKSLSTRRAPRNWTETMEYCEACGIEPAKWTMLGVGTQAATACAGMTYPLVVKVPPSECDHKTEMGLVKLRVRSAEEVEAHAADFRRRLGKPDSKVLVQEMVEGGVEVALSCLRNTDFGPIISVGTGGVAIELFRDVYHLALPVSPEQVMSAITTLKLWTLLQGYRGQPPADVKSLVRAVVQFGNLFLATPELMEFEINPLIVRPEGRGVIAVDALVVTENRSLQHLIPDDAPSGPQAMQTEPTAT